MPLLKHTIEIVRTVTPTELGTIILCSNSCSRKITYKRVSGYPFQYRVGYPVLQIPENPRTSRKHLIKSIIMLFSLNSWSVIYLMNCWIFWIFGCLHA